jgi:hypothetical protein
MRQNSLLTHVSTSLRCTKLAMGRATLVALPREPQGDKQQACVDAYDTTTGREMHVIFDILGK